MKCSEKSNRDNLKYAVISAIYFMLYCGPTNFASAFFSWHGYSNSEIAAILLCGSLLEIILHIVVSNFSDKSKNASPTVMIIICSAVSMALSIPMLFLSGKGFPLIVTFVFTYAFIRSMLTLITAFAFVIEKQKKCKINYGFGRGAGSLGYSIMTFLLGYAMASFGNITFPLAIVLCSFLLMSIIFFSYQRQTSYNAQTVSPAFKTAKTSICSLQIFKSRSYAILLVGSSFLFFGPFMLNTYLYQIVVSVGGNTADVGGIQAMAALLEFPAMIFLEKLIQKFTTRNLLRYSAVFSIAKVAITAFAPSLTFVYLGFSIQLISFSVFNPGCARFINEITPSDAINRGQGYFFLIQSISTLISNGLGGILIDTISLKGMLICAFIISTIGALILFWGLKPSPKSNKAFG